MAKNNPQFSHDLIILNQDRKILVKFVASLRIFRIQFVAWYTFYGVGKLGQKLEGNEDLLNYRYSSIGEKFCSKLDVVDTTTDICYRSVTK